MTAAAFAAAVYFYPYLADPAFFCLCPCLAAVVVVFAAAKLFVNFAWRLHFVDLSAAPAYMLLLSLIHI